MSDPEPAAVVRLPGGAAASTSALRPAGSTRWWRKLRAYVLSQPRGRVCQMIRDGVECGRYATTVDHVLPRAAGGTDSLTNLRPACAECNNRGGGLLVAARRPGPVVLTARQARLVAALDTLGLPAEAGRRSALAAWRASGRVRVPRSPDLDAACAWRRWRITVLIKKESRW